MRGTNRCAGNKPLCGEQKECATDAAVFQHLQPASDPSLPVSVPTARGCRIISSVFREAHQTTLFSGIAERPRKRPCEHFGTDAKLASESAAFGRINPTFFRIERVIEKDIRRSANLLRSHRNPHRNAIYYRAAGFTTEVGNCSLLSAFYGEN